MPPCLADTSFKPRRVTLIGSCAFDGLYDFLVAREPETRFERIAFNNGSALPPLAAVDAEAIAFQVVQLPIRAVMPEYMYLDGAASEEQAAAWFNVSKSLLEMNFRAATAYGRDHRLQTFMLNFNTPQQNAMGRLQSPYSLQNPVFYVAELNRALYGLITAENDMHAIDIDQIAASLGKRFIQDDSVSHLNHGSTLTNLGMAGDEARLEPIGDAAALYGERVGDYHAAIYDEVLGAYRSLRQHGAVKLVIFDLDDTLWRGVAAERLEELDSGMTEGWPLGVIEAASFLAKRGVLLAIVSKNDEGNVTKAWNELYGGRFSLDNFVAKRINWDSKVENILQILDLVNVGEDATLFVDDNPVERARVKEAIPGIRLLEGPVAEWRRQLLWSAELQPPVVTQESRDRATSIRGKAVRDEQSRTLDQASFLIGLGLTLTPVLVASTGAAEFDRCLELLNKTNQYNTTGRRWTQAEVAALFDAGGWLLALSVKDAHAAYGFTGLAVVQGSEIAQYVMSCRIFGLGVEDAAIALASEEIRRRGAEEVAARTAPTGRNHLSLDLYARLGFAVESEGLWRLAPEQPLTAPVHVHFADRSA